MEAKQHPDGFGLVKWNISKTLDQEFNSSTQFKTAIQFHSTFHLNFKTDKQPPAIIVFDWDFKVSNFIEYRAMDKYTIDYSTLENEVDCINGLIVTSYSVYVLKYTQNLPKYHTSFPIPQLERSNIDNMRNNILKLIHEKRTG